MKHHDVYYYKKHRHGRKHSDFGNEFYSGAATFGRVSAGIGAVFTTVIAVIFVIIGIVLLFHKTVYSKTTQGVIIDTPTCDSNHNNNDVTYNCYNIQIIYTVDGKVYPMQTLTSSGSTRYVRGPVTIYYDPSDPSKISLTLDNYHTAGIVLIVVGLIIAIIAWIWFVITMRYKAVAAVGGVSSGIEMIGGAFR